MATKVGLGVTVKLGQTEIPLQTDDVSALIDKLKAAKKTDNPKSDTPFVFTLSQPVVIGSYESIRADISSMFSFDLPDPSNMPDSSDAPAKLLKNALTHLSTAVIDVTQMEVNTGTKHYKIGLLVEFPSVAGTPGFFQSLGIPLEFENIGLVITRDAD